MGVNNGVGILLFFFAEGGKATSSVTPHKR